MNIKLEEYDNAEFDELKKLGFTDVDLKDSEANNFWWFWFSRAL